MQQPERVVADLLMDEAVAVFLHQSQATDHDAFCREAVERAPFGASGDSKLPFADSRAAWHQWMERATPGRGEVPGEAPQSHTMCVLPGTTVFDIIDGDPASTGVCLPHAVTAASGGGRKAALARHRGDGEELKRIEAVYSRLHRTGATHLAAWAASKSTLAPSSVAKQPPHNAAAAAVPSSVAEQAPHAAAAAAPSSVAKQPPANAAAAASSAAELPPPRLGGAPSSAAEPPPPRSGGAPKKKGKARKRVTHVTVDTNVMD